MSDEVEKLRDEVAARSLPPDTIEDGKDITLLNSLLSNPRWQIPVKAYRDLPEILNRIANNGSNENVRMKAVAVMARLHDTNTRSERDALRQAMPIFAAQKLAQAQIPEFDEVEYQQEPVAFIEQVSEVELIETAKALLGTSLDPDQEAADEFDTTGKSEHFHDGQTTSTRTTQSNGNGQQSR